jgi:hypothetical protein
VLPAECLDSSNYLPHAGYTGLVARELIVNKAAASEHQSEKQQR